METEITEPQIKKFKEISLAEGFLTMLESKKDWDIKEIKEFSTQLGKYLIDESIKLFSISKRIVEVIFDSE